MKRVLFSLAAAGLSLVLGLSSVLAGEPIAAPAKGCEIQLPCCPTKPKCCPQKCCKVECVPCIEKVCKPEPIKIPVPIVTYACRCEDYCLTKCPPMNLNFDGLLGIFGKKGCGSCAPACQQPCQVCQDCEPVRTRKVLIKKISICEEDGYRCVPHKVADCHGPALPAGEKLSSGL